MHLIQIFSVLILSFNFFSEVTDLQMNLSYICSDTKAQSAIQHPLKAIRNLPLEQ